MRRLVSSQRGRSHCCDKTVSRCGMSGARHISGVHPPLLLHCITPLLGHPKDQRTWSRVVGYVEQTDIHSPHTTVREALWFSAALRLDPSLRSQLEAVVDEALDMVELGKIQNMMVGEPHVSGEGRGDGAM